MDDPTTPTSSGPGKIDAEYTLPNKKTVVFIDDPKNILPRTALRTAIGDAVSFDLMQRELLTSTVATRDAIAATKKKELLTQTGGEFELTLLLTQAEALSYASHLAKIASQNESQPDRARALAGVSEDMATLYHEVFVMLLSKRK